LCIQISAAKLHVLKMDRYYATQQFTVKTDIFSFGIILLELISGCGPISREQFGDDFQYIAEWVSVSCIIANCNFFSLILLFGPVASIKTECHNCNSATSYQ
jgi:hypothetical protein